MTNLVKIEETKKSEIVTKEHTQLEKVLNNEKGYPISKADPKAVKTFLTNLISESFLLAGLKKLNEQDLITTSTALFDGINEKYPSFTNSEIKKAFRNGVAYEYKDRGNYNFALSFGTFMFFLKCYEEDKKKLKNSHVARSRATKKEKEINLDIAKIAQEKHDEFYKKEFDKFLNNCEEILIEGNNLTFSVLDDPYIIALTPFLQKECEKMNCTINNTQEKTINDWVSELDIPNVNYKYRVEFEVMALNLFRVCMNIPKEKYFVLFTKPNNE